MEAKNRSCKRGQKHDDPYLDQMQMFCLYGCGDSPVTRERRRKMLLSTRSVTIAGPVGEVSLSSVFYRHS